MPFFDYSKTSRVFKGLRRHGIECSVASRTEVPKIESSVTFRSKQSCRIGGQVNWLDFAVAQKLGCFVQACPDFGQDKGFRRGTLTAETLAPTADIPRSAIVAKPSFGAIAPSKTDPTERRQSVFREVFGARVATSHKNSLNSLKFEVFWPFSTPRGQSAVFLSSLDRFGLKSKK